jgi:hypothetical protein
MNKYQNKNIEQDQRYFPEIGEFFTPRQNVVNIQHGVMKKLFFKPG